MDLDLAWTLDLDFGLGLARTWTWIVTIADSCRYSFVYAQKNTSNPRYEQKGNLVTENEQEHNHLSDPISMIHCCEQMQEQQVTINIW